MQPAPRLDQRRFQRHEDEEIVEAMRVLFKIDREINRTYASVGDRPIFTVPLTDQEEWGRWQNPQQRAEIIKRLEDRVGPEAVPAYVQHMATVDRRLHRNGKEPTTGSTAPPTGPTGAY